MRAAAAAFLLMMGLGGCQEPDPTVIDGSSPDRFKATTTAARDDLPVADRIAFDEAINTVPARRYGNRDPGQLARTSFDGMTAEQVVAVERRRQAH